MNPVYQHLTEQIATNEARVTALRAQIAADSQQAIRLGAEQVFTDHPQLIRFCWTQRVENEYNDNTYEDCTYIELLLAEHGTEAWNFEYTESCYTGAVPAVKVLEQDLFTFLHRWDEQVLLSMLGDYTIVEVTRQGLETYGYDERHQWEIAGGMR